MISTYRAAAIAVVSKLPAVGRAMLSSVATNTKMPRAALSATTTLCKWQPSNHSVATMSTTTDIGSSNNNNNNKRPFTILGVQQIAIGHDDRAALNHLWYTIFGLQPSVQNIRMENENVCEDIVRLGGIDEATCIEIDLMTPLDINKSPKVHVPPLNHIGLWVDDIHKAVEWMTQQGVRFTPGGIRPGAAGYNVTFIHPRGNETSPIGGNGILIELVQAPDHIKNTLLPPNYIKSE